MKQNKIININRQEYELYLMIYGGRMQVRGFRQGRIPTLMLHSMIGNEVLPMITKYKVNELLKNYSDVKNVKTRTSNSNEPEMIFKIEVEFEGIENKIEEKAVDQESLETSSKATQESSETSGESKE